MQNSRNQGLKVLHVIPTLDRVTGGPAIALVGFVTALRRAGVGVSVVVGQANPDDRELLTQVLDSGTTVTTLGEESAPEAVLRSYVAGCDVCHIHAIWEDLLHRTAIACWETGTPFIFRPCGMLDPWCLAERRIKKRLYIALRLRRDLNRCAGMHFTTRTERDLVRPLGLRSPSVVEGHGVDLVEFRTRPETGMFRSSRAIGDRPFVLFLGRLHRKKGFDLLIPAFARLAARNAVLVIAGPDVNGYRSTVEAMATDAGVADRVLFTGVLRGSEKVAALADADLFVLPSYQENFGVAVIEALAAETPVIVSDQVNLHGEITASGVGAVVPMDVETLAREIDRWLADPALRQDAARRCRLLVRTRFDWAQIAQRWAVRYAALARGDSLEAAA